jgi:hypothetical protein
MHSGGRYGPAALKMLQVREGARPGGRAAPERPTLQEGNQRGARSAFSPVGMETSGRPRACDLAKTAL